MDAEKKRLRDEVAKLIDAVHDLRDDLAAERLARAAHHCHGCHCVHPTWVYPNVSYRSGGMTSGGYTVTNALSQGN